MVTETRPTLDGYQPESKAVAALAARLQGEMVQPGDPTYETIRAVWNDPVDGRPALIVRCADVVDVIAAVDFARLQQLSVAVRSGGNRLADYGTGDGGVLIDLSNLKEIDVDPVRRIARIEPGLTWAEVAAAVQPDGLALTSGNVDTAGIGGPIISHLRAVEIVTVNGRLVRACATEYADLYWRLCGGDGNVGVAVAFVVELVPGETVLDGRIREDAAQDVAALPADSGDAPAGPGHHPPS
jgi:FAD/FMN-containing dehydrogenase